MSWWTLAKNGPCLVYRSKACLDVLVFTRLSCRMLTSIMHVLPRSRCVLASERASEWRSAEASARDYPMTCRMMFHVFGGEGGFSRMISSASPSSARNIRRRSSESGGYPGRSYMFTQRIVKVWKRTPRSPAFTMLDAICPATRISFSVRRRHPGGGSPLPSTTASSIPAKGELFRTRLAPVTLTTRTREISFGPSAAMASERASPRRTGATQHRNFACPDR